MENRIKLYHAEHYLRREYIEQRISENEYFRAFAILKRQIEYFIGA